MAKPGWVTTTPLSGSGSRTVNVGASEHTGRLQRTGTLTYKATGVADISQQVTQEAKPEFVAINNISAGKDGGNVTITGKSNSSKLNFTLGAGDLTITLPTTYNAGGATATNNVATTGDPGANAEYDISITINVPANTTTAARTKTINVMANGGQSTTATISQSAGDSTLSVSPTAITIPVNGAAVMVTVSSNTNWTVE